MRKATDLMPRILPLPTRRRVGGWLGCALFLTGCGEVRDADDAQILTVVGRGPSYHAYQDGSGAWQPLGAPSAEGSLRVTLDDSQGRYGVMTLCLDEATGNVSAEVRHALLREVAVVTTGCAAEPAATGISVSGRIGGLGNGDYGNVYLGDAAALVDSSAPEHRLELPAARYDLIATRYSRGERVPSRIVFTPGVVVTDERLDHAEGSLNVDFGGPDAFEPQTALLPLIGSRPDELLSGSVEVVTQAGTVALLGEHLGGGTLLYARIPERKLRGATLRAAAQSFSYDDRTKAGSSRSVSRTFAGDEAPLLALPQPLAEPTLSLPGNAADAVRPRLRWRAHPAGPGSYTQFFSQLQGDVRGGRAKRSVSYRLSQSPGWRVGQPYSYALPDFSALPEWQEAWNLRRGEPVFWEVSFRRTTQTGTHVASRSGVLTP